MFARILGWLLSSKAGTKLIDEAIAMFDVAIKKLEEGKAWCHAESAKHDERIASLEEAKAVLSDAAGRAARTIDRLKELTA